MTVRETPVFFPSGPHILAGIVTEPQEANGLCVMIPWGAGAYPSSARNRIRTRLARAFAADGFHVFRFDYEGVAESEGTFIERTLDTPTDADIRAASGWLAEQGFTKYVIVGNCFGAWSSLLASPDLPGLQAIAMINAPVKGDHADQLTTKRPMRRWIRKLRRLSLTRFRDPDERAKARRVAKAKLGDVAGIQNRHGTMYRRVVRDLTKRGVPVLALYGDDGGFREDFESELSSGMASVFEAAGSSARYVFLDLPLTGYPSLEVQDAALAVLTSWVNDVARSASQPTGRSAGDGSKRPDEN